MTATAIGPLLKQWRHRRSMSQMALAHAASVSPRHLSFVETGRSRPSAELVLALAIHLDVSLRERNEMLLAAGFAPRYDETPLDDDAMDRVRVGLQRLLDAHDPYPGVVLDGHHDIVALNSSAERFLATLPASLAARPVNLFRSCLHPDGLGRNSSNFESWAPVMIARLSRLMATRDDATLAALHDEVMSYPNISRIAEPSSTRGTDPHGELFVSSTFVIGGVELSLFSTLTSFGSPRNITLDDLTIELFFPADDHTDATLRE